MSSRILQVADIPVYAEGGEPFAGEEPARGGQTSDWREDRGLGGVAISFPLVRGGVRKNKEASPCEYCMSKITRSMPT